MKTALGVRDDISTDLVLDGLNRSLAWAQWMRQYAGFGNTTVDRKDDNFVGLAGEFLMTARDNDKQYWSHGLLRCIYSSGVIERLSYILQNYSTKLFDGRHNLFLCVIRYTDTH